MSDEQEQKEQQDRWRELAELLGVEPEPAGGSPSRGRVEGSASRTKEVPRDEERASIPFRPREERRQEVWTPAPVEAVSAALEPPRAEAFEPAGEVMGA